MKEYLGCGNHGCLIQKPRGQGSNSGCKCIKKDLTSKDILRLKSWVFKVNKLLKELDKFKTEAEIRKGPFYENDFTAIFDSLDDVRGRK